MGPPSARESINDPQAAQQTLPCLPNFYGCAILFIFIFYSFRYFDKFQQNTESVTRNQHILVYLSISYSKKVLFLTYQSTDSFKTISAKLFVKNAASVYVVLYTMIYTTVKEGWWVQ